MSTTGTQALAAQVKPLLQTTKRKPRKKKRSATVSIPVKGKKK